MRFIILWKKDFLLYQEMNDLQKNEDKLKKLRTALSVFIKTTNVAILIMSVFLAGMLGIIFEILYLYIGDIGLNALSEIIDFYKGFFSIYVLGTTVAGLLYFRWIRTRKNLLFNTLSFIVFVFSAVCTHNIFMEHDTVIYYRMHGEFMPMCWDLGYVFFMTQLGVNYFVWVIAIIVFICKKIKYMNDNRIS